MEKWEAAYLAGIIDGEGSITLTRYHKNEMRRPTISISSNDIELLLYIRKLVGGNIYTKKNYNPGKHSNSYFITIKNKTKVIKILEAVKPFLRIHKKRRRAELIIDDYEKVTARNGKYSDVMLKRKLKFEEDFFRI